MDYIAGENEARAGSIGFRSSKDAKQQDLVNASKREKWPLWWTVSGVTIFCALVWSLVFQFLF